MSEQDGQPVPFDEACRFIIRVGLAAHGYGSPAARLEAFLSRLTAAFGYRGVFSSAPTDMVFAFQEKEGQWQRVYFAAMPGTGLDLDKLARVGDLIEMVVAGEVSPADAAPRLDEIDRTPPPWGRIANALSFAVVGAAFAVLLEGGWWDAACSTLFSLLVYAVVLFSGRLGARAADWLPLATAFVVGVLATAAKTRVPELNLVLVILAALVVLLPGYTVSLGIIELVSQHVVSGTANLVSGLVYLGKQVLGAWLGVALAAALFALPAAPAGTPVNRDWLWLFVPLLILGLCVIFQTSRRDLLWACVVCAIAYGGIVLGSAIVGPNAGNLLGTIVAVVFANLWATRTRRPMSIVLLPAIILLVSGSIGFRGLAAIAQGQTAVGGQQFLHMFFVALTIAAGLLVGNTLVRSKVTL